MTKKELLEAVKDMPEDAEVIFSIYYSYSYEADDFSLYEVSYISKTNTIRLC